MKKPRFIFFVFFVFSFFIISGCTADEKLSMEEIAQKRKEVAEWGCPKPLNLVWYDEVHNSAFRCEAKFFVFSEGSYKLSVDFYEKTQSIMEGRRPL